MAKLTKAKPGRPKGTARTLISNSIVFDKEPNFREDSMRGAIFTELKSLRPKYENIRLLVDAVCDSLEPKIGTEPFMFKRQNGKEADQEYQKRMLRFSVNRTIFDYARYTNQH